MINFIYNDKEYEMSDDEYTRYNAFMKECKDMPSSGIMLSVTNQGINELIIIRTEERINVKRT